MHSRANFQIPKPPPDSMMPPSAPYPLLVDNSGTSTSFPPLAEYRTNPNPNPNPPYPTSRDHGSGSGGLPSPSYSSYGNDAGRSDKSLPPSRNSNSMPSSASAINTTEENRTKNLSKFINKYEINKIFADRLRALKGYEIVFVCDDSGSMNLELHDSPGSVQDLPTRWDELKRTVSIVVDVATTLDPDGVDVYFLNRPALKNVRSSEELHETFSIPPDGPTPIVPVLRTILQDKRNQIYERKLLLLIATDGQPTDRYGNAEVEQLRQFLERERRPIEKIPVTIIACTEDDDNCMSYLNDWDGRISNFDVVDDYQSEKKQILGVQGPNFPFSFGDYVMKILLGGVDPWFGQLEEKPVSIDHPHHSRVSGNSSSESRTRFSNPKW